MVASSTSPSYCPHLTDMLCFVLEENDTGSFCTWMFFWSTITKIWFHCTYTSPSGVYFDPEMSNWERETLSPSTLSMMNIWWTKKYQDLLANVLLLMSGGIWTFRIHVSIFSVSYLWWRTYLSYTHLIGGEGSGLVRADNWSAAQSLHRGQTPDNGVFLCHATGSQSQAGGDDSGQACNMGTGIRQTTPRMKNAVITKTISGIRTNIKCSAIIAIRPVMIWTIATSVLCHLMCIRCIHRSSAFLWGVWRRSWI